MSDALQVTTEERAGEDGLLSVVYASTATVAFTELDLALLLSSSRLRNQARGLTGMLLHRDGRFIQALEGPEATVRRVLATISVDPRHGDVRILHEEPIADRRFGSWAMGYEAGDAGAPEWFGSPEALRQRFGSRADDLLAAFRDA